MESFIVGASLPSYTITIYKLGEDDRIYRSVTDGPEWELTSAKEMDRDIDEYTIMGWHDVCSEFGWD